MNKINMFIIGLSIGILIFCGCFCISESIEISQERFQPETTDLTIEHLWEDNGNYYFADTNGNIYKLGNYKKSGEKIRYADMPKQRFEMLNKGCVYNCTYVSGMDNWISIGEKEETMSIICSQGFEHGDTMKKLRYCSKCGKILNAVIMGDTCLTCLCGLDERECKKNEEKKDDR